MFQCIKKDYTCRGTENANGGRGAELKGEVENLRFVEFFYIAREVAIVEGRPICEC
jgi:hypothetical protein